MSVHGVGLFVAQLGCAAFLAILFLQSGLDKVLDWSGNRSYINSVFEKTPLKRLSGLLLLGITVLEVLTGAVSAAGVLGLLILRDPTTAFAGAGLATATVLSLFFGQRIAKDYAGAAGLVPYFIASVVSVLVQSSR